MSETVILTNGGGRSRPNRYNGAITREQYLFRELVVAARMLQDDPDPAAVLERIVSTNAFGYPTERELRSIGRACLRRLVALSGDPSLRASLVDLLLNGIASQRHQVALYAMARDNRLVEEFLVNVVAEKRRALDPSLPRRDIVTFLEGLCGQDAVVASWSDATLNKIRQVLAKSLEESGLYDRKEERLAPVLADPELSRLMGLNDDGRLIPAFGEVI